MKRIAYALVGDEILGTIASATEALAVGWRAQWFGTRCPPDAAVTVSCQSCLSRLGKNLGVALLTRHRGPLKLTETANRLLPHVRQICTSVNAIRTEISAVSGVETGSLRLASVPSLVSAILPALMSEFTLRFPGIELSIFEGTDPEVVEWVRTHAADVGYSTLPVPEVVDAQELSHDEWFALLPASFRQHRSVTLKFLSQQRFLVPGGGCETYIRDLFGNAKLSLETSITVKEMSTIHAMVAQRLGVGILPSLAVQKCRGIRAVPLSPRQPRRFGELLPHDRSPSPALKAWSAIVHHAFKTRRNPTAI